MENSSIINLIAQHLKIKEDTIKKTIELFESGHTIPFLARYRQKETDYLNETQLTSIYNKIQYYNTLLEKRNFMIQELTDANIITPSLREMLINAKTLAELDAIYKPYKRKKITKAQIAIKAGLQDVANFIKKARFPKNNFINSFIDNDIFKTEEDVLEYASYIIEAEIFENPTVRQIIKDLMFTKGKLITKKKADNNIYKNYYDFSKPVKYLESYQILAILRAEKEKVISYKIDLPYLPIEKICRFLRFYPEKAYYDLLIKTVENSLKNKVLPSVQNEIIAEFKEKAVKRALNIFAKNISYLLLTPPLSDKTVLGMDPGYKNGCKIAIVNNSGKLLYYDVIYPVPPKNEIEKSLNILLQLHKKFKFDFIAIGNGTASYETESFVLQFLKNLNSDVKYSIVSEAGASVYSVSKAAIEEFPDLSPNIRSAISIARRTLSPLNELVKIPPESIGVGMYQHDLPKTELRNHLKIAVQNVVNKVGIDINKASYHLLKYISGFTDTIAKNIIAHRNKKIIQSRDELKDIKGIGKRTFLLSAGFCRVPISKNPLDNTIIHPESYQTAFNILEKIGFDKNNIPNDLILIRDKIKNYIPINEEEDFIKNAILFHDYDPRNDMPNPQFNRDVKDIYDLQTGMILNGMIKNIVDFGIFVDIGTKENGLIYKTELPKNFYESYFTGEIIKVQILSIDISSKRLALKVAD